MAAGLRWPARFPGSRPSSSGAGFLAPGTPDRKPGQPDRTGAYGGSQRAGFVVRRVGVLQRFGRVLLAASALHADYSTQSGQGCSASLSELRDRFAAFGQEHVFRFWEVLNAAGRERLTTQAAGLDLAALAAVDEATRALAAPGARRLEPAPIQRLPDRGGDIKRVAPARERGEAMLAAGRVAALVVAGGQGTRLGLDGP